MEYVICTTCGSQYKRFVGFNQRLTNRHLAASVQCPMKIKIYQNLRN